MVPAADWRPKAGAKPKSGVIRPGADPEAADKQTPAWQFSKMDRDHENWGWGTCKAKDWKAVMAFLQGVETIPWGELLKAAGGKGEGKGNNHHSIPIDDMAPDAKARWQELGLEQFDTVFSMRVAGKVRLYGIRDVRVFRVVWYDKHHATRNAACLLAKFK